MANGIVSSRCATSDWNLWVRPSLPREPTEAGLDEEFDGEVAVCARRLASGVAVKVTSRWCKGDDAASAGYTRSSFVGDTVTTSPPTRTPSPSPVISRQPSRSLKLVSRTSTVVVDLADDAGR